MSQKCGVKQQQSFYSPPNLFLNCVISSSFLCSWTSYLPSLPPSLSPSLLMPGSHLGRLIYFGLIKHVWEPLLPHMGFDLLHRAAGLGLGSPALSSLSLLLLLSLTLSVSFHLQRCPALKHCLRLCSQRRSYILIYSSFCLRLTFLHGYP